MGTGTVRRVSTDPFAPATELSPEQRFDRVSVDDEGVHPPGDDELWSESWYLDVADPSAGVAAYVRLGLYPNLGVAWYWACLVGEGRPLVTVIDHDIARRVRRKFAARFAHRRLNDRFLRLADDGKTQIDNLYRRLFVGGLQSLRPQREAVRVLTYLVD